MLSSTLWRALTTPVTYILVAVLAGTAIMQVRYVNKALQRFDSTQVIPVQFVMFTLSVIVGSAILYRDFEKATAEMFGKFIGGCLLTFFGVFLITSGRDRHGDDDDDEEDEDAEDIQERIRLIDHEPTGEENIRQDADQKFGSIRKIQNGVSTQDAASGSRRSSKVSFADTASRPLTPRIHSNTSYPSSRVPPPIASSDGTEETPSPNPWQSSSDDLLAARHPGMPSYTSSPVLPSEAQTPSTDSLKPPAPDRSRSHGNLHTSSDQEQSPAPPQADRPVTPAARHSIARMMPGPIISPLSGGLSAVVADTLRRGVDSPGKRFKRPRLGLRRSKSGSQGLLSRSTDASHEELLGTSPLKYTSTNDGISQSLRTEGESSRITRARSLSNTLGDLFRGKRQKVGSRDGGGDDEEAGPSGS